jgi:hypothetical protein
MKRAWPALPLLLLFCLSCGQPSETGGRLPFGVEIHGLTPAQIGTVQIAVLAHGNSYTCATLTATCLRDAVHKTDGTWNTDLIRLRGDDGKDHLSYRPAKLDTTQLAGSGTTVNVSMPPSTNLQVVVEVLSPNDPIQVLASGCAWVSTVGAGDNKPLIITAQEKAPVPTCEPRID